MKRRKTITVPSFFWDDYLESKYSDHIRSEELQSGKRIILQAQQIIERFNERVAEIRNNPTATDPQKKMQVERIARQTKKNLEDILNTATVSLLKQREALESKIKSGIEDADRIAAMETRQKFERLNDPQKEAFIRQLQKGNDWDSIAHILGRSPAFLGVSEEVHTEARNIYLKGKYPNTAKSLEAIKAVSETLKRGHHAVIGEFDEFEYGVLDKVEKAEKALKE